MIKRLPYLLLPLGILIGYLIPRDANEHPHIARESPPSRNDRLKPQASGVEISARIQALADGIMSKSDGHSENLMMGKSHDHSENSVQIADIPAIIDRLLSQIGPSGLSWNVRHEIDGMLQLWAKQDFEEACQWARTHPNRNARKDFLEPILKAHAKIDFDSTLALLKSLQSDDGIILDLGSELFETGAKRGAKEAFEVLAACPPESNSMGGGGGEFPEGFDFKTFAELSAKHVEDKKGQYAFSHFPTNLLEQWAKIDAAAALDFYITNVELPFGDLGSITNTFLNMAEPASAYPWLLQQYENLDGDQRARFAGDLNSVFPQQMGAAPLISLASSITSPELREQFVTDMIKGFGDTTLGTSSSPAYIDLLSVLPSPAKRLEAISGIPLKHSLSAIPDAKFIELGITRDQIKAVLQN